MTKEDFIKKHMGAFEIDEATTLHYIGIIDLLENVYEEEISQQCSKSSSDSKDMLCEDDRLTEKV